MLTAKYYEDKANGELKVAEEVADSAASVIEIIDSIYDSHQLELKMHVKIMLNWKLMKINWLCPNSKHCGIRLTPSLYTW